MTRKGVKHIPHYYAKTKDQSKVYRFRYRIVRNQWLALHDLVKSSRIEWLLLVLERNAERIECTDKPARPRRNPVSGNHYYATSADGLKFYCFKHRRTRNHWVNQHNLIAFRKLPWEHLFYSTIPTPERIDCYDDPPPKPPKLYVPKERRKVAYQSQSYKKLPPLRPQSKRVLRKDMDDIHHGDEYDIYHYAFHDGVNPSDFDFDAYYASTGIEQTRYRVIRRKHRRASFYVTDNDVLQDRMDALGKARFKD